MGFTRHNTNQSFKRRGECGGFPPAEALSTTFKGKAFHPRRRAEHCHGCLCLFVAWVAPSGNRTHNHSLAFQIKKRMYTHY